MPKSLNIQADNLSLCVILSSCQSLWIWLSPLWYLSFALFLFVSVPLCLSLPLSLSLSLHLPTAYAYISLSLSLSLSLPLLLPPFSLFPPLSLPLTICVCVDFNLLARPTRSKWLPPSSRRASPMRTVIYNNYLALPKCCPQIAMLGSKPFEYPIGQKGIPKPQNTTTTPFIRKNGFWGGANLP